MAPSRLHVDNLIDEVEEEESRLDQIMRQQRVQFDQNSRILDELLTVKIDLKEFREEHRRDNSTVQSILATHQSEIQTIRQEISRLQQNPQGGQVPPNEGQVQPQPATREMIFTCTRGEGESHTFRFTLTQIGGVNGEPLKFVCPRCNSTLKTVNSLRAHIRRGTRDCQCRCPPPDPAPAQVQPQAQEQN